jgi:hypothetical protein
MSTCLYILAVRYQSIQALYSRFKIRFLFAVLAHPIVCPVPVFPAVVHYADTSFAVPTCSSGFLVKALKRFWQLPMSHKTNVLFIDTHAECRGCHYHVVAFVVIYPSLQSFVLLIVGETCMVRLSTNAAVAEAGCQSLAVLSKNGVDDPRHVV